MRLFGKNERGQVATLAAIMMVFLLGATGLAVDLGVAAHERRQLQNAADAMALAGASQLTAGGGGHSAATSAADSWATKNNVAAGDIQSRSFGTTCSGESEPNSYTVRLRRSHPNYFVKILGINSTTIGACATAARFSAGGGVGMAPFGVEDNCVFGADGLPGTGDGEMQQGTIITIKYDSQNDDGTGACGSNTGNFWTLAIDQTGSGEPCGSPPAEYEERKLKEAICYGSITPLCVPAALAEGESCQTTVDTQTGNQVGGIRDSINYVVQNAPDACDTLAEVVETTVVGGVTTATLRDACNPFLPGYAYAGSVSLVKLIPVLNGLFPDANGHSTIPIVNFLIVVIDPSQVSGSNWCKGNNCDLQAQLVGSGVNPMAFRRELYNGSTNNFTVLVK